MMVTLMLMLLACEPPPLPELASDAEPKLPSVRFIFPDSNPDDIICPDFIATVDIDNWELDPDKVGDSSKEDGIGHWHLRDQSDQYLALTAKPWAGVTIPERFYEKGSGIVTMRAVLAYHDHTELDTEVYPDAVATAEFVVADDPDCLGGGIDPNAGTY